MSDTQRGEAWHLDKRVPLALIATMAFQAIALIWWAATTNAQVNGHDNRLLRLESADEKLISIQQSMVERLARLEAQTAVQIDVLRRIEAKITP